MNLRSTGKVSIARTATLIMSINTEEASMSVSNTAVLNMPVVLKAQTIAIFRAQDIAFARERGGGPHHLAHQYTSRDSVPLAAERDILRFLKHYLAATRPSRMKYSKVSAWNFPLNLRLGQRKIETKSWQL